MEETRLPQCCRTSGRGRVFRRLLGLVCAAGVVSAIAPVAGKGAAPTAPATGQSAIAALESLATLRGASGKLMAAFRTPGEPLIQLPPPGLTARYETDQGTAVASPEFEAPQRPCTGSRWRLTTHVDVRGRRARWRGTGSG